MAMIVLVVSAIAGLYGLGWFVFAFVNPPSVLSYLYRSPPSAFYFLPERGARILMGAICAAIAVFASVIVPMFWS